MKILTRRSPSPPGRFICCRCFLSAATRSVSRLCAVFVKKRPLIENFDPSVSAPVGSFLSRQDFLYVADVFVSTPVGSFIIYCVGPFAYRKQAAELPIPKQTMQTQNPKQKKPTNPNKAKRYHQTKNSLQTQPTNPKQKAVCKTTNPRQSRLKTQQKRGRRTPSFPNSGYYLSSEKYLMVLTIWLV